MSDDDLRTALTKLADEWEDRAEDIRAMELRLLLEAHPAPTPDEDKWTAFDGDLRPARDTATDYRNYLRGLRGVDEAEVRERIAQDIEGETPTRKDLGKGGVILGERTGMLRAARIARGATR